MARRSSKAELVKRREEVQDYLLKGYNHSEIQEILYIKYKTSKRAIADDIRDIATAWKEQEDASRIENRNKFLARLELMFNKALADGHMKNALEIQKEIHKLNGLYNETASEAEPTKFVTLKERPANVVSIDEKKAENE
jgi:hypothetical protein